MTAPGSVPRPAARLVDERSVPSIRERLGGMLARAETADFAVARIRLTGLDLSDDELARVRRCRVLVGRVDAGTFADAELAVARDPARRASVTALRGFLTGGRLEVRSAGTHLWAPDFSILHGPAPEGEPPPTVVFVGCHYFARPDPPVGAAFTCVLTARDAAARATRRFDELWARAYDIGSVVAEMLDALLGAQPPQPAAGSSSGTDA